MKVFCLRLMLSGSPLYALTKDKPLPVPEVDVLIASQKCENAEPPHNNLR
ncbi:hypothetical protein QBD01_001575 [Ochrobactrum sp. 19YEA23]|nr:hypothetical protein [Ochrobactrum sp. 19YEA23]